MQNFGYALTMFMALAVSVGLLLVLLYAAMRAFKFWTPRLRRAYWRSVGAIYLVLAVTTIIGFAGIFGTGCEPAIAYYFSQTIGTPFDPSMPKCR